MTVHHESNDILGVQWYIYTLYCVFKVSLSSRVFYYLPLEKKTKKTLCILFEKCSINLRVKSQALWVQSSRGCVCVCDSLSCLSSSLQISPHSFYRSWGGCNNEKRIFINWALSVNVPSDSAHEAFLRLFTATTLQPLWAWQSLESKRVQSVAALSIYRVDLIVKEIILKTRLFFFLILWGLYCKRNSSFNCLC